MKIYLPHNFDVEKHVIGYEKKYREKYLWTIHTIIDENYKTKSSFFGFVNLQSKILEVYLGTRFYKAILETLEKSGVIEINPSYQTDAFSKSYRLSTQYSGKVVAVEFSGGKADDYLKKLKKFNVQRRNELPDLPVYHALYDNLFEVEMDCESARKYIDANSKNYTEYGLSHRQWAIDKFEIGDFYFRVDPRTGRVFNNLTNLPRELRQFLTYKGSELVQMDLSNSQPLLLCPFFKPYWESYQVALKQFQERPGTLSYLAIIAGLNEGGEEGPVNINGHRMWPQYDLPYATLNENLPEDMLLYIKLTQEGKFYDEFMAYLEDQGVKDVPARNIFKDQFFKRILFSTTERDMTYKYENWFWGWMPHVAECVHWYKTRNNDHTEIAVLLQKTEADIIIHGVCAELLSLDPVPFFLTIHDAIICEKSEAERIQTVLLDTYKKKLNLSPKAEIKSLKEE